MAFSGSSALEPKVQFLAGWQIEDRVGKYTAPALAYDEGTLVKLDTDAITLVICGDNDAQFILEQPCALVGPIGNATNREKWMGGIPQKAVACGEQITVLPLKSGASIRTTKIVGGTATGAITALTASSGAEVEAYGGSWRLVTTTPAIGFISAPYNSDDDSVEITIY